MRQKRIESHNELVGLLDRFLDDCLLYPLEWDDFVSWTSEIPAIEQIRMRIADTEPLICSGNQTAIAGGIRILLKERNDAAALAKVALREPSA